MSNEFKVIGDQVHFGPWVVATLKEGLPATIRAAVLEKLYEDKIGDRYRRAWDDLDDE